MIVYFFLVVACPMLKKVPQVLVIHGEGDGTVEYMKVALVLICHSLVLLKLLVHGLFSFLAGCFSEEETCKLASSQTSSANFIWHTPFQSNASCLS